MQENFNDTSPSWKCEEDQKVRSDGKCDFDICDNCMEKLGVRKNIKREKKDKKESWLFFRLITLRPGRWSGSWLCWWIWTICKIQTRKITQDSKAWSELSSQNWWANLQIQFFHKAHQALVQVDRIDYNGEGNLLQYAVKMNQKEYLQILLDYGWVFLMKNDLCWLPLKPKPVIY